MPDQPPHPAEPPIEPPPPDLPDPDAPMFPDALEDRDPERGQHLVWVGLAMLIMLIVWWGF